MKQPTPCATCQHLGDAQFPSVRYYVDGELKSELIGFSDRPNGEPVEFPARHCNHEKRKGKVSVYEASDHPCQCIYYEERKWVRPGTCGECQLHTSYTNGQIACSGHPFTGKHERDEPACPNGKVEINAQLTLF